MSSEAYNTESAFTRLQKIEQEFLKLEEVSADPDRKSNAIGMIKDTIIRIDREGLISKNEEIDDYSTSSLKFLYLNYYLGKFFSSSNSMGSERLENLKLAQESLAKFIETCKSLRLLHDSEIKYFQDHVRRIIMLGKFY